MLLQYLCPQQGPCCFERDLIRVLSTPLAVPGADNICSKLSSHACQGGLQITKTSGSRSPLPPHLHIPLFA